MQNKILLILFTACFISVSAFAKGEPTDSLKINTKPPLKKFFVGTALDGGIFSTATIQTPKATVATCPGCNSLNTNNSFGTIRFSYFLNIGLTFNFNLGEHFGIYTGIDVKNIGFIEQNTGGETVKRRTYNLGAPIGIKVGNMRPKSMYAFLGGGADLPFNYKEKNFVIRNQKTKFSEWFSQRTPAVMPYVFAGFALKRDITFKFQYYPGNFFNSSYTKQGIQPYAGSEVHLILLSIGYAMPVKRDHDMMKDHFDELNTSLPANIGTAK